jgi:hypothetical protein
MHITYLVLSKGFVKGEGILRRPSHTLSGVIEDGREDRFVQSRIVASDRRLMMQWDLCLSFIVIHHPAICDAHYYLLLKDVPSV